MILNRKQVKQLRRIFKENKEVDLVTLVREGKSGIGENIYADYISDALEDIRIDITDYSSW